MLYEVITTKLMKMLRHELRVKQEEVPEPQHFNETNECNFRGIRLSAEHGLTEERAAKRHAI